MLKLNELEIDNKKAAHIITSGAAFFCGDFIYSRITLKLIQCDWDEFFVASVITASKENLYQSHTAITSRFYFELTIYNAI